MNKPTSTSVDNDTIAAIATAPGEAGLAVIRISGPEAFRCYRALFVPYKPHNSPQAHYTARYGTFVDTNQVSIDDVVVLAMRAPNSFTGEDTVEISCHGGNTVTGMVLNSVIQYGIRLARPGEFTLRAFLNGKLDLAQCEAVADLVHARTEAAVRSARRQLDGGLSNRCSRLRSELLGVLAAIEVTIDYSDEVPELDVPAIALQMNGIIYQLQGLLNSAQQGRLIREGLHVVIVGKPNVGKSSLLNRLLGYDRAIVSDTAGTTRDILQEAANINGVAVTLVDTAGLRTTDDFVEKQGVERAEGAATQADVIIAVADAVTGLCREDQHALQAARGAGCRVVAVVNRCDLVQPRSAMDVAAELKALLQHDAPALVVSAVTGEGITALRSAIAPVDAVQEAESVVVTSLRHQVAINAALSGLHHALEAAETGMPSDFITIDVKGALNALSEITGEGAPDELVHRIFKDFCVGK
jgi:tRNA modification GTPase